MLHDAIQQQQPPPPILEEQLPIEDIPSPINPQIFEFCENDFFPETLQNSEVSSCSNYCYDENSSYTNLQFSTFPSEDVKFTCTETTPPTTTTNTISAIYDPSPNDNNTNDINAPMSFLTAPTFTLPQTIPTQDEQFDISTIQPQIPVPDVVNGLSSYQPDLVVPLAGVPLPLGLAEDCIPQLPSYGSLDPSSPSCSLMDPNLGQFMPGTLTTQLSADGSGIYTGSIFMSNELQPHELEFQSENVYGSDSMQQCYSSGDIQQGLNNENPQLVSRVGSSNLSSEISNLEESAYKIGRLSVEERKERIHRYMKKRNERNFSKKIKYACRKTLADSRPRVRGRFAKNDDFGETTRPNSSNHDDEDDEEVRAIFRVTVKEEDDMVDSSDIFAHISGVNSFKCNNYPLQSWI